MGRGLSIDTLMAEEGTFTLEAYRRQAPEPPEPPSKPPQVRVRIPLAPDSSWRLQAACIDRDPRLWINHTDGGIEAERICQEECAVRSQCLKWALSISTRERVGLVIGGHLWTTHGKPTKRPPRKACRSCGVEFQPRQRTAAFCGRCEDDTVRVPNGSCHGCGKSLIQSRRGSKRIWCSNACCCRAYYARNQGAQVDRKRRERAS